MKRAENRADRLEWEAEFTIDYAIASVESEVAPPVSNMSTLYFWLAVLDAVDGRLAAEEAKQA